MLTVMALVAALLAVGAVWGTVEVARSRRWEMAPLVLADWLLVAVTVALVRL